MRKFASFILAVSLVCLLTAPVGSAQAGADGRPKIVVTGLSDEQISQLSREVPEVQIVPATKDDIVQKVADADGLVGACSPELVRAGKKLRWIQVYSAGVENYMFPELVNSNIVLTNAKIIQGPEIADHAMGLLLVLTRSINRALVDKAREEWGRGTHRPIELRDKTALIIGLGGIGTQIAERAAAFGMKVLAVDPKDIPLVNSVDYVGKPDQLLQLLPQADVVFMAAPHTRETEGMLGQREFAAMKRGAYFINVSRGKTVRTDALVEALKSGHLAGAGLDVVDPEPLPKGHPLWKLENVVITPHIAGQSDQVWERRLELIRDNMKRLARGLPLRNVVDKAKGY